MWRLVCLGGREWDGVETSVLWGEGVEAGQTLCVIQLQTVLVNRLLPSFRVG